MAYIDKSSKSDDSVHKNGDENSSLAPINSSSSSPSSLEDTKVVEKSKPSKSSNSTRYHKVYLSSGKNESVPTSSSEPFHTHDMDFAPVRHAARHTLPTPSASQPSPQLSAMSKESQLAYAAGESDPYVIKEKMARGAESVLYRTQCGAFTFCAKSIRNNLSKFIGGGLTEATEKLENVKYSTKLRHILNEYEISKKLFQPEPMPVVRMYGLRKVTRFGFEVGYDLLLEYLEGHDLADRSIYRNFTMEDKLKILSQSIQALEYVHRKSIIHLDIKPSNFMLVKGRVKLIDFGVSVMCGHRANAITGTGGYLSPEQICKETIDERTDIFAFGVAFIVFFGGSALIQPQDELMSKRGRQDARERLSNMTEPMIKDIPELSSYPGIAEILSKCTIPKRDARPASCALLQRQLKNQATKYGFNLQ